MSASGGTGGEGLAINSAISGVSSIFGAIQGASAAKQSAALDQQIYEQNAKLADLQAADAVRRGEVDVKNQREKTRQLKGTQRVGFAAQGVDIDTGSAGQVIQDTELLGEKDVQTLRNNAWREAFGYKVDALNSRSKGAMGVVKAQNEARSTILTGGMKAFSSGVDSALYATGKKGSK